MRTKKWSTLLAAVIAMTGLSSSITLAADYTTGLTGAYRADNKLVKVSDTDIRPIIAAHNAYINIVPVVVLLMSNQAKFGGMKSGQKLGAMDAGYVSQNIYLYNNQIDFLKNYTFVVEYILQLTLN